jgi:hypothetical protein
MAKRVLLVEWLDAINIEARLAVRNEDSTAALLVYVSVDVVTGLVGVPSIWRCATAPDAQRCRVLGGLSTHVEVTALLMQPAMTAFSEGGQEGLYLYLEGAL